jgi:hypothetical protein
MRGVAGSNRQPGNDSVTVRLGNESKVARFEQLRKDIIGAVYKRLAKVLHPDLEADPVEREKKSRAMQEVTAAYARTDLHALLCLELIWIEGAGSEPACFLTWSLEPKVVPASGRILYRTTDATISITAARRTMYPRCWPLVMRRQRDRDFPDLASPRRRNSDRSCRAVLSESA